MFNELISLGNSLVVETSQSLRGSEFIVNQVNSLNQVSSGLRLIPDDLNE
jgi:hypothetical protein